MAKVIAICGKICSGKSYYARQLKDRENAVVLSCDELTSDLFDNNLGDRHDEMSRRIHSYLLKKTCDIVDTATSVILDWGFWSRVDRDNIREYFTNKGIECEIHYVHIDDQTWDKNISERNRRVLDGKGGSDYYLDDGLKNKLMSKWEEPTKSEIDVWYNLVR